MAVIIRMTNPERADKALREAEKSINRANVKTIQGLTLFGQRFAKKIAPHKTGALKRGIKRRPVRRKGKVVSSALLSMVPRRGFKTGGYHWWVNEEKGFETVTLPRVYFAKIRKWPTRKWREANKPMSQRKWRYRDTDRTGTPGYFKKTLVAMKKVAPRMAVKNLSGELKRALKIGR